MNGIRTTFSLILLISLAALVGCAQRQAPDPSMTATGSGAGARGGSADWISPEDIARAQQLGLEGRDSRFGSDLDGRITNLFDPVFFDFDQSFVRPADRPILQEVANYMSDNRSASLILEGHCDWRGTTEYNMALGDRRANAVKAYLVQIGVSESRIDTVSKGDLEANTGGTEAEMQRDRRVDIIVIP